MSGIWRRGLSHPQDLQRPQQCRKLRWREESTGVSSHRTLLQQLEMANGYRSIVSYMTKQSMPAVSILENKEKLDEFKTADKVVLVAYFATDDKTSNETYTEVANSLRDDYLFGATNDVELATE